MEKKIQIELLVKRKRKNLYYMHECEKNVK